MKPRRLTPVANSLHHYHHHLFLLRNIVYIVLGAVLWTVWYFEAYWQLSSLVQQL